MLPLSQLIKLPSPYFLLLSATLRRLLVERHEVVSAAVRYSEATGRGAAISSFLMGSDPSPLAPYRAFLTNYLSSLRGVLVLYPLASMRLHDMVAGGILNRCAN